MRSPERSAPARARLAAAALTDTGPRAYENVEASAKRFADGFEEFRDDYFEAGRGGAENWPEIKAEQLPNLRVTGATTGECVREALDDVLLLAIANVVFFMLGFVFFLRYDVR